MNGKDQPNWNQIEETFKQWREVGLAVCIGEEIADSYGVFALARRRDHNRRQSLRHAIDLIYAADHLITNVLQDVQAEKDEAFARGFAKPSGSDTKN